MTYNPTAYRPPIERFADDTFYAKIMGWLFVAFTAAAAGIFLIGPMIPQGLLMPLYFVAFAALLAAGFSRKMAALAPAFTVGIPVILGIILYPTLNYLVATGAGNIVGLAASGTALVFGTAAIVGWKSKKSLESWTGKLFVVLLGAIGLSLLNVFFFQAPLLSLVISLATLVIFSIYSFIDIQRVRDRSAGNEPAQYALNIFLNIYNIFVSLLNIFSAFR